MNQPSGRYGRMSVRDTCIGKTETPKFILHKLSRQEVSCYKNEEIDLDNGQHC